MTKGAWIPITDTSAGETRWWRDEGFDPDPNSGSEFSWSENNFACDCNRGLFFAEVVGDPDPDAPCKGSRYYVSYAKCDDGQIVKIDDWPGDAETSSASQSTG